MVKNYWRIVEVIPIILLVFSVGVLVNQYLTTGEWIQRDIDLKSGTVITLNRLPADIKGTESALSDKFGSVTLRQFTGYSGSGVTVEFDSETDANAVLAELQKLGIDTKDASVQSISTSLGESFWAQAQLGIIVAFVLMGTVVFVLFRTFVPSMAVIISAASDIIETLAFMQIFDIKLSLAGLAAVLMLIGYSVDTDILLTSRVLKTKGKSLSSNVKSAFNTGIGMTGTTIVALVAVLIFSPSPVLTQIANILLIGLILDIINTWLQNVFILRIYCEMKHIGE